MLLKDLVVEGRRALDNTRHCDACASCFSSGIRLLNGLRISAMGQQRGCVMTCVRCRSSNRSRRYETSPGIVVYIHTMSGLRDRPTVSTERRAVHWTVGRAAVARGQLLQAGPCNSLLGSLHRPASPSLELPPRRCCDDDGRTTDELFTSHDLLVLFLHTISSCVIFANLVTSATPHRSFNWPPLCSFTVPTTWRCQHQQATRISSLN